MNEPTTGHTDSRSYLIMRHTAMTRIWHWINALCLGFLLLSGLQIFNAWPSLYWGQYGADGDPAVLTIGSAEKEQGLRGFVKAGGMTVPTTGVLGVSDFEGQQTARAFPAWATLPAYQDLAAGRRWHFFFAWLFVINGAAYLAYGLLSGHFRRNLLPTRSQLALRHLLGEIVDHARLRFPKGEEARHYNALQKISYLAVIALLLPVMVLTGLTMSPGLTAAVPVLLDVFGGRQTARTIHFISASLVILFLVVHLAMVLLSGVRNNLRSMITGRYAIEKIKSKP